MTSVNVTVTGAGAQPTPPAQLRDALITLVTAERPGYTANLPGSLIEDIASTSVGALSLIDQAAVDLLNSLSANTANPYLLSLIGSQKGIARGLQSNASAYVTFLGMAGFTIPKGFVVSDGANQYVVQDGGTLGNATASSYTASIAGVILTVTAVASGVIMVGDPVVGAGVAPGTVVTEMLTGTGKTGTYKVNNAQTIGSQAMAGATHGESTLYVVAKQFGTWAIIPNSITTIITSVPAGYALTCTNSNSGFSAITEETDDLYRARVLEAELSPATGTLALVKSMIRALPGVQARLVSVSATGKIMVGGGDPYEVAGEIYKAMFDISDLSGSSATSHAWAGTGSIALDVLTLSAVSSGVVMAGDIVSGAGMASPTVILSQLTGTPGADGTYRINYAQTVSSQAMTGAASERNQIVAIVDDPDTYYILFVVPVQQIVEIICDWSTIAPNFTANISVQTAIAEAFSNYINSIPVGMPINVFSLQQLFLESIVAIIPPSLISAITLTVKIDGATVAPSVGTGLVYGDLEGYVVTDTNKITVNRV